MRHRSSAYLEPSPGFADRPVKAADPFAAALDFEPGQDGQARFRPARDAEAVLPLELITHAALAFRRWPWSIAGGMLGAALGLVLGLLSWKTQYVASAVLAYREPVQAAEGYQPRPMSAVALGNLLRSPELQRRFTETLPESLEPHSATRKIRVQEERNNNLVTLVAAASDPAQAMQLANGYSQEVLRYTQELLTSEAKQAARLLAAQMEQVDAEIARLKTDLHSSPVAAMLLAPNSTFADQIDKQIQVERAELITLLTSFTEAHPLVQKQRAKLRALEEQLSPGSLGSRPASALRSSSPPAEPSGNEQAEESAPSLDAKAELALARLSTLENGRWALLLRLRAAELFADNAPGYFEEYAKASLETTHVSKPAWKVALLTLFGGLAGVIGMFGLALFLEVADTRLNTPGDLKRVAQIPVLAALNTAQYPSESAPDPDALLQLWLPVQSQLRSSGGKIGVVGLVSSDASEGLSNLGEWLAQAARQCGQRAIRITIHADCRSPEGGGKNEGNSRPASFRNHDLFEVSAGLESRCSELASQENLHLHLPDAAVETRLAAWKAALECWSRMENLVVIVEMPPAKRARAVLLAASLPALLWLAEGGKAQAAETRRELQTLRQAGGRLVGCVLLHNLKLPFKDRLARWQPELAEF